MNIDEPNYAYRAFHAICILGTISLISWCIYIYALDDDMTVIHIEEFHSKPDYIYPSISLCASDIFYEKKLKKFGVNQTSYESYLRGEYFEKGIADIPYEDVAYNPADKLLGISFSQEYATNGLQNFDQYYWYNHVQRNETSPPQWTPSFHVDPFNRWYGHIYKCLTVDVPFVSNQHLSWMQIIMQKSFFPKSLRPLSISSGGMFMISVGFPNQRKQFSTSSVTWNAEVTNKSYVMRFQVTGIDVIQARNKKSRPCDDEWREYDKKARNHSVVSVGCIPPYWKSQYSEEKFQICSDPKDMNTFYQDAEMNRHTFPCRRMTRLTTNFMEFPTIRHDKEFGPEYRDKYFAVYFYFPRASFKNIVLVRAFDIQTLIGNAGGYIGLFLGHTLLQIPGFIYYLWKNLRFLFKSKKWNDIKFHQNNEPIKDSI